MFIICYIFNLFRLPANRKYELIKKYAIAFLCIEARGKGGRAEIITEYKARIPMALAMVLK